MVSFLHCGVVGMVALVLPSIALGTEPGGLFLGCGRIHAPGRVVKVDLAGQQLSEVKVEETPNDVVVHGTLVYAVLPNAKKVVTLDGLRNVNVVLGGRNVFRQPITVAIGGNPEAVIVADNLSDTVCRFDGNRKKVLFTAQSEDRQHMQDMYVGVCGSKLIVAVNAPHDKIGTWTVDMSPGQAGTPKKLLTDCGYIAVQPGSQRWAVIQGQYIYIMEDEKQITQIALPKDKTPHKGGTLAWCGETLVTAFRAGQVGTEIMKVDQSNGTFTSLFAWSGSPDRMQCMTGYADQSASLHQPSSSANK